VQTQVADGIGALHLDSRQHFEWGVPLCSRFEDLQTFHGSSIQRFSTVENGPVQGFKYLEKSNSFEKNWVTHGDAISHANLNGKKPR